MKKITVTPNVLTRFKNLKKRDAAYTDVYIALKKELQTVVQNGGDKQPTLDKLQAAYAENKHVNIKLDRMIKKYGKVEAVMLPRDTYTLALTYPRDGMGKLHLRDDAGFHGFVSGCGYDKRGAVLGKWVNAYIGDALNALNDVQIEALGCGVNRTDGRTWVDGSCGESCMVHMLEVFGFSVKSTYYIGRRKQYVNGWVISKK